MDLRAVIFVPALTGSIIFGFVFALFAAHHYLTVLQSTAAGARRVTWLVEPILDHFWKFFYLAWLGGLWFGPAWLAGRAFAGPDGPTWLKFAVPLAVLWVCYPVSQLSSLSGPTIWLPLLPEVFDRMARKPAVVLGFMLLSGATLAGLGLALYLVFRADGVATLVVGCPFLVLMLYLYARLLGRLADALAYTKSFFGRKRKKKPRPAADEPQARPAADEEDEAPAFVQPRDLPPIQTPDEGPLTGYDVRFDDRPADPKPRKRVVAEAVEPEPPRRRLVDDEEDVPYEVNQPEVVIADAVPREVVKPTAEELRLISRDDRPRRPRVVWGADLFAFLAQSETWVAAVTLSGMCFAAGTMVRIAREYNPAGGE